MAKTNSFWHTIKKPIIGLAPMDGITDPAFRAVVDEIGHPDVLYTEFVSADGLVRNRKLFRTFLSHMTETPLVGQLFGSDPVSMGEAAAMLIEKTSIKGIDVNMGCPNRHVAYHGGGAGLIRTPKVAQQLIASVKQAVKLSKKPIGVSVKTRIGYDDIVTSSWISTLLEAQPEAIALHGRTLKQLYSGLSHWDEIKIAATLAHDAGVLLLGNGDIQSLVDAQEKISSFTPDGVLIGRGSFGNPWVFTTTIPTIRMRQAAAIRHCELFTTLTPSANPLSLRKHLAWYLKGFPDAASIRNRIMTIETVEDARTILTSLHIQ